MKAKHKLFFVLPLLTFLFTQLGFTQSGYTFKVLGVSGSVKKLSSTGEVNLTTGSKLQPEESIVVENGYCGLIHSSGKGVEVKKSGTYLVSDLNKSITSGGKQAKVSDRYVNYVIGQLTKEESEDINSNHRKYMEVTGAVERTSTNYIIKMVALSSNEIQPKQYTISWNSNIKDKEYILDVQNLFNESIFSARTKENSAAVDFGPLFAKHGKNLIVSVKVSGRPEIKSKEYSFKQASENLTTELGLNEEASPANFMVNGMICEENNRYMDALSYYKEASRLEATVDGYKVAYENLLKKITGTK